MISFATCEGALAWLYCMGESFLASATSARRATHLAEFSATSAQVDCHDGNACFGQGARTAVMVVTVRNICLSCACCTFGPWWIHEKRNISRAFLWWAAPLYLRLCRYGGLRNWQGYAVGMVVMHKLELPICDRIAKVFAHYQMLGRNVFRLL